MQRTAEVISVEGKYAVVKSERSSMCEGCHKNSCGGSCSAGMIMGADKHMTAKARNDAGASVGDTVEIETSDGKILLYALLVFIVPIVVCAILYGLSSRFFSGETLPLIFAAGGFVITFVLIGIMERRHSKGEPDIVITKIVEASVNNKNQ